MILTATIDIEVTSSLCFSRLGTNSAWSATTGIRLDVHSTGVERFGLQWCSAIRHGPEDFTLILVPCVIDDVSTSRTYQRTPVDRPSSKSTSIPQDS